MKKALTAGLLAAAWLAAPAMATPVHGTNLQTQFNNAGAGVDVNADQYHPDEIWTFGATGGGVARILFEFAGFASSNFFGIYDVTDPSRRLTIFTGPDGAGWGAAILMTGPTSFCSFSLSITSCRNFGSDRFGFFLTTPQNNTFFSQTSLNGDGFDHMVAYQGGTGMTYGSRNWLPNEFILAWEDLYGGGDKDYDDFAVMVESVVGVPEPGTLTLFGLGLLATAFGARRRAAG